MDTINTYIATLSLFKNNYPPAKYRLSEEKMYPRNFSSDTPVSFEGAQTNEAPIKYYMWLLAEQREVIKKMIVIVSDECKNKKLSHIENKTTVEYFHDKIVEYINQLASENEFFENFLKSNYNNKSEKYFKDIFVPIKIPDKMSTEKWKEVVSKFGSKNDKQHIYFDFTGGSRVASLVSLLSLRFFESSHSEIKQIIYSDIITDRTDPKLVDCTSTYKTYIETIEKLAKATINERGAEQTVNYLRIANVIKEENLEKLQSVARRMDALIKKYNSIETRPFDEQEKDKEEFETLMSSSSDAHSFLGHYHKEFQKVMEMSPFDKLKKKSTEAIIKDFHESIISIFYDYEIIVGENGKGKSDIQDIIKANDSYYTAKYGVIVRVQQLILKKLNRDLKKEPLSQWESFDNLMETKYIENVKRRKGLRGMDIEYEKYFTDYLKNSSDYDSILNTHLEYIQALRVFCNYGFPFMCNGKGGNTIAFPDIMDYYRKQTSKFIESLAKLKKSNPEKYQQKVKSLSDDKNGTELEKEIPYMYEMPGVWKVTSDKFANKQEVQDFITKLCYRIEQVRPFRNAIVHNLTNEYSAPEKQKEIAKKIRQWLDEYKERFEGSERTNEQRQQDTGLV